MSESVTGHAVRSVRTSFSGRMPSGSELARAVVAMTFTSAIGTLTGHPLLGVYLAIGAMWGLLQDLPKPLGSRAIRLLVTATAGGLGTVIGVLAAEDGATPVRGAVLVVVAVLSGVASGSGLLWSVAVPHGHALGDGLMAASLDHSMWFHRPFRADDWVLCDCTSPSASGGRGLATGRFFSQDGKLIASAVQEGVIRVLR